MEKKKSFILYLDYKKHLDLLSREERGDLLTALFEYAETGEVPPLPPMATMAFSFIQAQLERDAAKYEATVTKRREAGKLGGRPRIEEATDEKAKKANGFSEKQMVIDESKRKQTKAKKPDNDNGTDISTGEISISQKPIKRFSPPTVEEIRAYCVERKNQVDPERFVDYYQAREWKLGKDKVKDWRAAVRTWERNGYGNGPANKTYKTAPLPKRKYDGLTE